MDTQSMIIPRNGCRRYPTGSTQQKPGSPLKYSFRSSQFTTLQNERKCLRRETIKHHTPAEACLNLLDELNFYTDSELGKDNRIQRLHFTDPKSTELVKS
jgi:hypothetical protein